ncbi:uncharacterized protein LOC105163978 [Sesamum indicum]|uniref:Uncharacterized protein LOC105163978 n=1 Tax=Sesamum indicum TaxID=4182 RepID=A0A6I9TJ33_SESIN|nr:uncharacterized protein LOC105163978 [Sesamum indicum]
MTMPRTNTQIIALNSIRTKPSSEEKLSSRRRLSRKEHTMRDVSSFDDVYYQEGRIGIPFRWESQPGTPKVESRDSPLPPLTPPPSFHSNPISRKPPRKNNIVPALLLPKLNLNKAQFHQSPSRSSCSSSSSSPWSTTSSPLVIPSGTKQRTPPRRSFDSRNMEAEDCESPVSTLCFRAGRSSTHRASRGCTFSIIKLLLGELS